MKHLPNLVPKHWLNHRIWLSSTVRWEVSTDHAWWNFRIVSNFIFSGFSLAHLDYGFIPQTLASWFDLVLSSWHILRNLEHKEFSRSKPQPFTENLKDHYFTRFFHENLSSPNSTGSVLDATRKNPLSKTYIHIYIKSCKLLPVFLKQYKIKEGGSSERVKEWIPNILPPERISSFFIFSWVEISAKHHRSLRPEGRFACGMLNR